MNFYQRMGILPLKKRVNRDKCSFATKQRMFGVFAIDEILRYRGTRFPSSRTLCHPGTTSDFRFYEDASDEFREFEGTLLPLWKFAFERAKVVCFEDFCIFAMWHVPCAMCLVPSAVALCHVTCAVCNVTEKFWGLCTWVLAMKWHIKNCNVRSWRLRQFVGTRPTTTSLLLDLDLVRFPISLLRMFPYSHS